MATAARCASEIESGVIVVLLADAGWKYLSSNAWTGDLDEVTEEARRTLYF
jgi:cysteine synthase B